MVHYYAALSSTQISNATKDTQTMSSAGSLDIVL